MHKTFRACSPKAFSVRYYVVFKRIERQLAAMPVLDLQFASPILKRARNLRLAIPGLFLPRRLALRCY